MTKDVVTNLIERGITVSVMESCTGGLVASSITDVEGASGIFTGSLITYSNEAKVMAGVPQEIIEDFGVYSEETAVAMAETARRIYGSDIAVGVTGTFGNTDPANPEGVPGNAWYCVIYGVDIRTEHAQFDAGSMSRHDAKKYITDLIFEDIKKAIEQRTKGTAEQG